ncbi:unnamed protein product [Linum trigynum]|uniref:Uncharacterized protein n=1 Tax=Linum trigynum TaxID=586398 RepID=A0AAV2GRK0_9ROSI
MAITSAALTAKAKFSIHSYFDTWNRVLLDGFFGGLMVCFSSFVTIYILRPIFFFLFSRNEILEVDFSDLGLPHT